MNSRYEKIKRFLEQENFQGFTKRDLFIKNFVRKAWGQDIAALSNMAEVIRNTQYENTKGGSSRELKREKIFLIDRVVQFAIHPKGESLEEVDRKGLRLQPLRLFPRTLERHLGLLSASGRRQVP